MFARRPCVTKYPFQFVVVGFVRRRSDRTVCGHTSTFYDQDHFGEAFQFFASATDQFFTRRFRLRLRLHDRAAFPDDDASHDAIATFRSSSNVFR